MKSDVTDKVSKHKMEAALNKAPLIALAALVFMTLIYFAPRIITGVPISLDSSIWGAFGDFFGGILNPILSILTIYLLVYSIKLQSDELGEATKQLKLTSQIHSQSLLYPETKQVFDSRISDFKNRMSVVISNNGDTSKSPYVEQIHFHSDLEAIKESNICEENPMELVNLLSNLQKFNRDLLEISESGKDLVNMGIKPYIMRPLMNSLLPDLIHLEKVCETLKHSHVIKDGVKAFSEFLHQTKITLIQ